VDPLSTTTIIMIFEKNEEVLGHRDLETMGGTCLIDTVLNYCLREDVIIAEGCGPLYRRVDNRWCNVQGTILEGVSSLSSGSTPDTICCGLKGSDCCELNPVIIGSSSVGVILLIALSVVACYCCCCRPRRQRRRRLRVQQQQGPFAGAKVDAAVDKVQPHHPATDLDDVDDGTPAMTRTKTLSRNHGMPFESYHKPATAGVAISALATSSDLHDEFDTMNDSDMIQEGMLPQRGEHGNDV
jgi:hypothetical protein